MNHVIRGFECRFWSEYKEFVKYFNESKNIITTSNLKSYLARERHEKGIFFCDFDSIFGQSFERAPVWNSIVACCHLHFYRNGLACAFCPSKPSSIPRRNAISKLSMATVPPSLDSTVGIVGRGFVSILTAKLAALAGYQTWVLLPTGQTDTVLSLIDQKPENLDLIESADTDAIESRIESTDALIIAVDDDSTMDEAVINYFLNPESATRMKRVVAMSRNLNGEGMGFLVKASKLSANREVWDGSNSKAYHQFESTIKKQAEAMGIDYPLESIPAKDEISLESRESGLKYSLNEKESGLHIEQEK